MAEAKCDVRASMNIILEYRLGGVRSTDISIDILPLLTKSDYIIGANLGMSSGPDTEPRLLITPAHPVLYTKCDPEHYSKVPLRRWCW